MRVLDRGRGMSEDVMRKALVPFYSTKPRMRLAAREGGGTVVTCWLRGSV